MSHSDFIGHTLGNRYVVRRRIGAGGMGAVYEVEHIVTKRIGALKLLFRSFAAVPELVESFAQEAAAAEHIGNPHIVETIEAGELETGEPYVFMELLQGSPVSELILSDEGISFDAALEIAVQAADGLAAAHQAGIIHHDIKPESLFVCRRDAPFVKILDFGMSKFAPRQTGEHITRGASATGAPYYMSPEEITGKRDIDGRTDVFSLGVVLYECVTGRLPFEADTLSALGARVLERDYALPSRVRPGTPPAFDTLIARALQAAPDDRFESMSAFRDALLSFRLEQTRTSPASVVVKRKRIVAGVAVAAAMGVVAWFLWRGHENTSDEAPTPSAVVAPRAGVPIVSVPGVSVTPPEMAPSGLTPHATPPLGSSGTGKDERNEADPFAP